jgi:glycosyltransferase involved in cell wall biosynthesis
MLSSEDVLFVGKGTGVVPWYRTGLPAFNLGCDWIGAVGRPNDLRMDTSLKRGGHVMPNLYSYKVIVLQQVHGPDWMREICRLRDQGIKVIYEVDDYLHGVRRVKGHSARRMYTRKVMPLFEMCMRVCDAMIVSTEWLANAYKRFNRNIYVCRNGVDSRRYAKFRLPRRRTLNFGWAGGEGHLESVSAWLPAIDALLRENENYRFISIGLSAARALNNPKQAVSLPFISIENFPGALTNIDVAIAPAARNSFFAAKSDLRFLETGALAIPLVADPFVYRDCIPGETALYAENADEAYEALRKLAGDAELRKEIGYNARDYVNQNRSIERAVEQWEEVFVKVTVPRKIAA